MNTLSAERIDAVGPFNLLLAALDVADGYDFIAPPGLTAVAISVPVRDAIIALTHAGAPIYRDRVLATAMAYAADVVLLRQSDDTDMVSADVALAAPRCAAWVEHDLTLWMDMSGLWLVPHGFGPSVEISDAGFRVTLVPPYPTLDARAAGIARAARAFALHRSVAVR